MGIIRTYRRRRLRNNYIPNIQGERGLSITRPRTGLDFGQMALPRSTYSVHNVLCIYVYYV